MSNKLDVLRKSLLLPLFALLSIVSAPALADEVDALINTIMAERHIPGLQLAVVRDGKIIKQASYGVSNIQDQVPVSDKTVFPINSMTKAFTGVALVQLAEQGHLSLDDPIGKHLPDLPKDWQAMKIKHLMAHTAGLPSILSGHWVDLIVRGNPDAAWEKVQTLPLQFEENTQFRYNQTGYVIIGKILDKYVPNGFPTFITNKQLKPLNMSLTADAGFDYLERPIPNQARQYFYNGQTGQYRNFYGEFSYMMRTAAGMSSTATELAHYLIALQSGKLVNDLDLLWTPVTLKDGKTRGFNDRENGYAMGWQVVGRDQHRAISASGGDATTMITYPDDNLSIVVLTNLIGTGLPTTFVDRIAALYIDDFEV
ncbi:beta-lactamase family protein [Aestuariibacter halophilus]|uniref:Beta-lactamase family protein n=1 Tax=Fluctibacter halophilus TaxID=226011 RepID=A0ABS8G9H2_9ALTE|nr:serine hydrolase domain-containing protein [Aestuariibacter halophilus]MCC2617217.1 beta-lactamase family protein [Aestuariibacter halophilus]